MLRFFKKKENEKASLQGSPKKSDTHFYTLTVSEVRRETADAVSVAFEISEELREKFTYMPGQYLTLKATIGGEEVRRSYSICSAPHEGELRVAIKQIEGGKFSTWANTVLAPGMSLESMPPMGNFKWEHTGENKHYVGWAAGSGITPIASIAKSVLNSDDSSTFTLFYGNRNASTVIFKEELEDLKNQYFNRFELHHIMSGAEHQNDEPKGRIDGEKAKAFHGTFFDVNTTEAHYLCGPLGMIEGVSAALEALGTPKANVHFELFNTAGVSKEATKAAESRASDKSMVTVILDGVETHFEMGPKDILLDAAMDHGADAPFACKGAVCCTCRAKVLEGSAEMVMNYALVDDEVKDGYILTCQSHATSEKLVVSFDE